MGNASVKLEGLEQIIVLLFLRIPQALNLAQPAYWGVDRLKPLSPELSATVRVCQSTNQCIDKLPVCGIKREVPLGQRNSKAESAST